MGLNAVWPRWAVEGGLSPLERSGEEGIVERVENGEDVDDDSMPACLGGGGGRGTGDDDGLGECMHGGGMEMSRWWEWEDVASVDQRDLGGDGLLRTVLREELERTRDSGWKGCGDTR